MVYADTSILVSMVMFDDHSETASELLASSRQKLVFTGLLNLEVSNAIRVAVGSRKMTEQEGVAASLRVESFKKASALVEMELDWLRVFARASGLIHTHSAAIKSRTLDTLHVAAAMELGVRTFWSFDNRQKALASAVGLKVNS
jgi:hypothetical protein